MLDYGFIDLPAGKCIVMMSEIISESNIVSEKTGGWL